MSKPSYAKMVVRVLEDNVSPSGSSMTRDAIERAIRERWGNCSQACLSKAIQKVLDGRKIIEHAQSSFELAPAAVQRVIRKRRRASRPSRVTGYNLFVREQMASTQGETRDADVTERMSTIATRWRALDDDARGAFAAAAAEHNGRNDALHEESGGGEGEEGGGDAAVGGEEEGGGGGGGGLATT